MIANSANVTRVFCLIAVIACLGTHKAGSESNYFYVTGSSIKFRSEAALETISAESQKAQGLIDISKKTFAFSVLSTSFNGFNSSLQREHFNENYLESEKFPTTIFKGKIIEDIDYTKNGMYDVRAKGTLLLHGISQERIIKSKIIVKENGLEIESRFFVLLNDHNIRIPKVVHEKVAEEILIEVKLRLERK